MSSEPVDNRCEPPEYEDYDESEDCWNCGGTGFVSSCVEEWACMYPDEGCDLCTTRCDVCNPRKPAASRPLPDPPDPTP